jgi:hypothetical protein
VDDNNEITRPNHQRRRLYGRSRWANPSDEWDASLANGPDPHAAAKITAKAVVLAAALTTIGNELVELLR